MTTYNIRVGDVGRVWEFTLGDARTDENPSAWQLSPDDTIALFTIDAVTREVVHNNVAMAIVDAAARKVRYTPSVGDVAVDRDLLAQIVRNEGEHFPSLGWDVISIRQ